MQNIASIPIHLYSSLFLGIPEKEVEARQPASTQTSVDSNLSGQTDSGFTEANSATSDIINRSGFRPLSKYFILSYDIGRLGFSHFSKYTFSMYSYIP